MSRIGIQGFDTGSGNLKKNFKIFSIIINQPQFFKPHSKCGYLYMSIDFLLLATHTRVDLIILVKAV